MTRQYQDFIDQAPATTPFHSGPHNQIFRFETNEGASVAVKTYADESALQRELGALTALRQFGINLAPEPLYHSEKALVMTWIEGDPLQTPPDINDTQKWNRMMAAFGASGDLYYMDYTAEIPMQGKGYQNPVDLMDEIDTILERIDEKHPLYPTLDELSDKMNDQIVHEWNQAVEIGLCRRNYALRDLIWDGYHLLTVDWADADWGDMAAEIGLWSAHPDYEGIPESHWTWARWEFARLTKDEKLVPRATVYARLGQLYWAMRLTADDAHPALRDRYLARARKIFR